MNVRKPADFSGLFAALNELLQKDLPQTELYYHIGQLICERPEKGAAVAAAGFLHERAPDMAGFSPRNVRRMRDFYRTYEYEPTLIAEAMKVGWTQNTVILESELTQEQRLWYLRAVRSYGWSKAELVKQIQSEAHLSEPLDGTDEACYTELIHPVSVEEHHDEDPVCVPRQYLPESDGGIPDAQPCEERRYGIGVPRRIGGNQRGGAWEPGLPAGAEAPERAGHRLLRQDGASAPEKRLRRIRPAHRYGRGEPAEYAPLFWQRPGGKAPPADGLYRTAPCRGGPVVHPRLRRGVAGYLRGMRGAAEIVDLGIDWTTRQEIQNVLFYIQPIVCQFARENRKENPENEHFTGNCPYNGTDNCGRI